MNQIIKDVLEERAAHAEAPHVDAARLIRSGRRLRTARRGIGALAVAALAAAAVAVTPMIVEWKPGGDGSDEATTSRPLDLAWADADYIYYGDDRTPRPDGYFYLTSHEDSVLLSTSDNSSGEQGPTARGALYEWRPREGGDPELIVDNAVGYPGWKETWRPGSSLTVRARFASTSWWGTPSIRRSPSRRRSTVHR